MRNEIVLSVILRTAVVVGLLFCIGPVASAYDCPSCPAPTFRAPVTYSIVAEPGQSPYSDGRAAAGDFNNDGKDDMVMKVFDRVLVILSTGDGTFDPPIATWVGNVGPEVGCGCSYSWTALAVGDFDSDGNLDVVAGTRDWVGLAHGDGTGHFGQWYEYPGGGDGFGQVDAEVGDVNGDGNLDLVILPSQGYAAAVMVWLGDGFALEDNPYLSGSEFLSLTGGLELADFNQDGVLDILTSSELDTGSIMLGQGNGYFVLSHIFDGVFSGIEANAAVGDFNSDGYMDVGLPWPSPRVYLGAGAGIFGAGVGYGSSAIWQNTRVIYSADINGDNKLDLITPSGLSSIAILIGDGSGAFSDGLSSTFSVPASERRTLALGDFNGDGKKDIGWMGFEQVSVLINSTYQTPVGPNSTAVVGQTNFTFENVTAGGTTTVTSIDPATAGDIPGGFAVADIAFEVTTTAAFSGSVTSCFSVPTVNNETDFLSLRVLHKEGDMLVDRTSSHDFANRKICATTTSFSPFYLATVGKKVLALFDRTRAFKSGSTVPVKVQILGADDQNLSSANLPLTVRGLRRIGSSTVSAVTDAGNSNPDYAFRYDNGAYMYNLKTTGLEAGKYVLSFYAGTDQVFFYTIEFQVK